MQKTQENQGFQGIYSEYSGNSKKIYTPSNNFAHLLAAQIDKGVLFQTGILEFWNFGQKTQENQGVAGLRGIGMESECRKVKEGQKKRREKPFFDVKKLTSHDQWEIRDDG